VELCIFCGEIADESIHHKGTEIAQRTTEMNFPTDSEGATQITGNQLEPVY